jgi:transaldolase
LNLDQSWENFDLAHELTAKGIRKFVEDYQSTLEKIA